MSNPNFHQMSFAQQVAHYVRTGCVPPHVPIDTNFYEDPRQKRAIFCPPPGGSQKKQTYPFEALSAESHKVHQQSETEQADQEWPFSQDGSMVGVMTRIPGRGYQLPK